MKALAVLVLVFFARAVPLALEADTVRIVQTNSAGDNIHLIDPATNTIVGEITGIEVNHGAAAAPDGSRFYFSDEAEHTLDVVDGKTLGVTKRIALSGRPNNVAISRDGRHVYVAIVSAPGDRKSTRLNSSHVEIPYAVFCLKKKSLDLEDHVLCAAGRATA